VIELFRSLFAPPRHLILILVALWLGLALAEKRAERYGISRDALNNLVFYSLFGYLLGGRILYAVANFTVFVQSPLNLFSINLDLFDPLGALAAAALTGLFYGSQQRLSLWPVLDALTPLFAVTAIGVSLAHLAAGTAFGAPTDLPWAIELWNAQRHPTQIYHLIAAMLIFSYVWFAHRSSHPGALFLTFTTLTAAARLFLEAFRGDSTLISGGIRLAQLLAWVVLIAAFLLSEWWQKQRETTPET
jgi:phosphatidylglycerol---prolipoprotein diacylglyceryl transferase